MGNMTAIIVVCSICGVLIVALLIAFKIMGSRSSKHKLDDQIEKYRRLGSGEETFSDTDVVKGDKKQLKQQKKQQKATLKTEKLQEKINKKVEIENLEQAEPSQTEQAMEQLQNFDNFSDDNKRFTQFSEQDDVHFDQQQKQSKFDRDKDFNDFMNEHSYSRVISNKKLLKEMSKLPNKVKALLLGNVFNKFDD